jgi:two-component system sensor histidine kinase KdpD
VVGAVDSHDREVVVAELGELELVGDGRSLDTAAVLARRPEVVCVDDLTEGTTTAERRFAAARRLAEAGLTVIGTVQLARLGGPGIGHAPGEPVLLDEAGLLALADEIELVDVPPTILADRVRRGEIVPADRVATALATTHALPVLRAERERAFALVAEHGERRLAAYEGEAAPEPSGQDRQPVILACAGPWPGMEPLIRRAAALAAGVDGQFRVATVRPSQPDAGADELLAEYAALTEQLGGEFVDLAGPSVAAALADYASRAHVTELVLERRPNQAGRYPVLRELARLARDVELHVVPGSQVPS